MQETTELEVGALRYYAIDSGTLAGHHVLLARTGYTGEVGFEIYCRPEESTAMWTSGAPSPTLGHPIAMAYVDDAASAPGTKLIVDVRGSDEDAEAVTPPFHRRSR